MTQDNAKVLRPKITANHSHGEQGFYLEIDLAGADKDKIDLEIGTYGLSVRAEGDGIRYKDTFPLGYNIIPEKTKADYKNGVLFLSVPVKEKTLKGTRIEIKKT